VRRAATGARSIGIVSAANDANDANDAIIIRELAPDERAWANELYRAIEFAPTPPDALALVAELSGARVGLGRLVTHAPGVVEMGGIWTEPSLHGRGIARRMVKALMARLPPPEAQPREPVWCLPFAHLAAFYQSFGFALTPPPWPASIAAKIDACIVQGLPSVIVLARR
jgi:GNAT superfamily N-acetyltransferase